MKQLPHTIQLLVLAHPEWNAQATKLAYTAAISVVAIVSAILPVQASRYHPSQQPAPYYQEEKVYESKKIKKIELAQTIVTQPAKKASKPVYSSKSIGQGFELIKQCESGGNYSAINSAGYYGAYQFNIGTWDSTASAIGRTDLVGVRPDKASPADQDTMALALHSFRGWQPWGCAYHVGLL